jgi:hypothetical protein
MCCCECPNKENRMLIQEVPVLLIIMVLLIPFVFLLSKKMRLLILRRIISFLQKFRLIDIGRLSYAQLKSFGIEDFSNNKIVWVRQ